MWVTVAERFPLLSETTFKPLFIVVTSGPGKE